jgi:hypothetical protein
MLLPYTQRIGDPRDFDYQLAQMLNEPYRNMKDDIDLHDQANWIEYDRESLRKATFVSGPHFWNDKSGQPHVTLMFDVTVRYTEGVPKEAGISVPD